MALAPNPLSASRYPVDPAWGDIGSNLVSAVFGNPEARAKAQYMQAELARAQAEAGKANSETQTNQAEYDSRFGSGPGSLGTQGLPAAFVAAARGNRAALTAEGENQARGGDYFFNALHRADPTNGAGPSPLAAAVAGAAPAPAYQPGAATSTDPDDGAIVVHGGHFAQRAAPPPPAPPVLDEQTLRLAGALMGHMPTDTTAYTPEYGDARQAAQIAGENQRNKYTADSHFSSAVADARIGAGATVQSAGIHAAASRYGTDQDNAEKRWSHTTPGASPIPFAGAGAKPPPKLAVGANKSIDDAIKLQMPGAADQNIKTAVSVRAAQLAQQNGNRVTEAVRQAIQENVTVNPTGDHHWFSADTPTYAAKPQGSGAPGAPSKMIHYDNKGNRIP